MWERRRLPPKIPPSPMGIRRWIPTRPVSPPKLPRLHSQHKPKTAPGCDGILPDGQHQVFNWDNPEYPFRYSNMVRIGTSGVRQSCFFHSVLRAIDSNFGNLPVEEREIRARRLREELAEYLTSPSPDNPNITVYETLARGELPNISLEEANVGYIRSILLSDKAVGQEIIELTSNYIDRDIYILDCVTKDVFRLDPDIYYKDRRSIVLLNHSNGCEHFETVGIFDINTGNVIKEFQPYHDFIRSIRSRLGPVSPSIE